MYRPPSPRLSYRGESLAPARSKRRRRKASPSPGYVISTSSPSWRTERLPRPSFIGGFRSAGEKSSADFITVQVRTGRGNVTWYRRVCSAFPTRLDSTATRRTEIPDDPTHGQRLGLPRRRGLLPRGL